MRASVCVSEKGLGAWGWGLEECSPLHGCLLDLHPVQGCWVAVVVAESQRPSPPVPSPSLFIGST